jgi:hypothetical protein
MADPPRDPRAPKDAYDRQRTAEAARAAFAKAADKVELTRAPEPFEDIRPGTLTR